MDKNFHLRVKGFKNRKSAYTYGTTLDRRRGRFE